MKNRSISIIILLALVIGCGFGTYYMLRDDEKEHKQEAKPQNELKMDVLRSSVYSGKIENSVLLKGIVVNRNIEELAVVEGEGSDKKIIKCSATKEVKKGEVLFSVGDKDFKSPVNGRVVNISESDNHITVSVLDYDSLFIDVSVNYALMDKFAVGSEVNMRECNELSKDKECVEKVVETGYEIVDNNIDIYFTNSRNYLPGTEFESEYNYYDEIDSCYVLSEMLIQDATGTYVYIDEGDNRTRRDVVVGREFSSFEDDVETKYTEIISGVSEGEKLIVDIMC